MSRVSQSEILWALKIGLDSRQAPIDVVLLVSKPAFSCHLIHEAPLNLLRVVHRIKGISAPIARKPVSRQSVLSHGCDIEWSTLIGLLDDVIRRDSPVRSWYELGAYASEWLLLTRQGADDQQRGVASGSRDKSQVSSKSDDVRSRFQQCLLQLKEEGADPVKTLAKLTCRLTFFQQLLFSMMEIDAPLEGKDSQVIEPKIRVA